MCIIHHSADRQQNFQTFPDTDYDTLLEAATVDVFILHGYFLPDYDRYYFVFRTVDGDSL